MRQLTYIKWWHNNKPSGICIVRTTTINCCLLHVLTTLPSLIRRAIALPTSIYLQCAPRKKMRTPIGRTQFSHPNRSVLALYA